MGLSALACFQVRGHRLVSQTSNLCVQRLYGDDDNEKNHEEDGDDDKEEEEDEGDKEDEDKDEHEEGDDHVDLDDVLCCTASLLALEEVGELWLIGGLRDDFPG